MWVALYFVTGGEVDLGALKIICLMLSKFAITLNFAVMVLYIPEVFPTNLRYELYLSRQTKNKNIYLSLKKIPTWFVWCL